jgi:copper chaperone CopZ
MKRRLLINFWVVLFALLPMTASAAVTRAIVSVDGMSCPFCAFGVEKKLKTVDGVSQVEVAMKDGSATLIAEQGKSIEVGQIGPAVEAAGFTPGVLEITATGTVKQAQEDFLLEVSNSDLSIALIDLTTPLKEQLRSLTISGAVANLSGTVQDYASDRPRMTPAAVQEVTP